MTSRCAPRRRREIARRRERRGRPGRGQGLAGRATPAEAMRPLLGEDASSSRSRTAWRRRTSWPTWSEPGGSWAACAGHQLRGAGPHPAHGRDPAHRVRREGRPAERAGEALRAAFERRGVSRGGAAGHRGRAVGEVPVHRALQRRRCGDAHAGGRIRAVPETRAMLEAGHGRDPAVALRVESRMRRTPWRGRSPSSTACPRKRRPRCSATSSRDGPPSSSTRTAAVVRLAREAGVPVPANAFLYASLWASEQRARGCHTLTIAAQVRERSHRRRTQLLARAIAPLPFTRRGFPLLRT